MKRDLPDTEEFHADFALGGEVECEEAGEEDSILEIELLVSRVQAARYCGA